MIGLPGRSHRGPLPPLDRDTLLLRDRLMTHVELLAGTIGERNVNRIGSLERAAKYIEAQFAANGYEPGSQEYAIGRTTVRNIDAQKGASIEELLLVGAHYDSVPGCPGANDNGSGVAAILELSRLFASRQ